jgi:hypothetical protein
MATRWRHGLPPQDDRVYEVKQRLRNAGGQWQTVQWKQNVRWNNGLLYRISQLDGKPRAVLLTNRWRISNGN